MKALLLGSISVLADTSELQRQAFNVAFKEAGLGWEWSQDTYRKMLTSSGGRDRIADYAKQQGVEVDAAALHARKTEVFQETLANGGLSLRPETERLLAEARNLGAQIAFVSGTSGRSLDALLGGFGGARKLGIDLVTSEADADAPKPDPSLYQFALNHLGVDAEEAIAVEDNQAGIEAANAAGITVYVYPNANTQTHDFGNVPHISSHKAALAA